jgi:hypothetical protein
VFSFRPYGPFEVPVEDGGVLASELNDFWKSVEKEHPALPNAVGCYIFATQFGNAFRPWDVGKTERKSFRKEAFTPHKLLQYREALKLAKRGTPLLFLIARVTENGRFKGSRLKGGIASIGRLEDLLIGTSLSVNPKLVNRMTKKLGLIQVPGYMNEAGPRSIEAKHLAALLGTKGRSKAAKG